MWRLAGGSAVQARPAGPAARPCLSAPCPALALPLPLAVPQELQQQNARLLVINRQLGEAAEATRAEAEAALRADNEAALQELAGEIEELRGARLSTEKVLQQASAGQGGGRSGGCSGGQAARRRACGAAASCLFWCAGMQLRSGWLHSSCPRPDQPLPRLQPPHTPPLQVVRQRDTLRQLLQSSGNDLDAARRIYASTLGSGPASPGPAGGVGTPGGTPGGAASPAPTDGGAAGAQQLAGAGGPDYASLHSEMEAQLREFKAESSKTQEMLSSDVRPWGGGRGWARSQGPGSAGCLCSAADLQARPAAAFISPTHSATHPPLPPAGTRARRGVCRQERGQPGAGGGRV